MQWTFSQKNKYLIWRKLWISLAKAEKEVGLEISSEQIQEMEQNVDNIDFAKVEEYEKTLKHDVMAHIAAFSDLCPNAKKIIHLGATSCFVTDNGDLIQMREGLKLLTEKTKKLIQVLSNLAKKTADIPTVGFTHLQPAQPTTVGKRICLWLQDFVMDLEDLRRQEKELKFLGVKGATGTQGSFLKLLENPEKVEQLDRLVAKEMGFKSVFTISGQTYTRKQDMRLLSVFSSFAASAHKCATDLRLLSHMGEMSESKAKTQVGSSAMPHKANPIYAERICSLARFLISLNENPAYTLATQWLERSLDDSANRRLVIPQSFLSMDAILDLLTSVFETIQINTPIIKSNLKKALPLLALENILMLGVKKGADRQQLHEKLRTNPEKGLEVAKELGFTNEEIESCFEANTGRAKLQVQQFLAEIKKTSS